MRSFPTSRSWGGVLAAAALVLAAAVAINLTYRSSLLVMELVGRNSRTADPPALGAMIGQAVLDGSEWTPEEGNPEKGKESFGVLFAVAAPGELGDFQFWLETAALVHEVAPRTQLVGMCMRNGFCGSQAARNGDGLLLLKAMDPVQMHALATGARKGKAFLFRGSRVTGSIAIDADREQFARRLGLFANQHDRRGGI